VTLYHLARMRCNTISSLSSLSLRSCSRVGGGDKVVVVGEVVAPRRTGVLWPAVATVADDARLLLADTGLVVAVAVAASCECCCGCGGGCGRVGRVS